MPSLLLPCRIQASDHLLRLASVIHAHSIFAQEPIDLLDKTFEGDTEQDGPAHGSHPDNAHGDQCRNQNRRGTDPFQMLVLMNLPDEPK